MKKYIVYITTNIINGKKYIGSHQTLDINDNYLGSGVYLKKAIKKYGRNNFVKDILSIVDNIENMKELEEYYINYYSAFTSKVFYNATKYSAGITQNTWIDKIKEKNKGNKYHLGFKHSEETKIKMSISSQGPSKMSPKGKEIVRKNNLGNKYALGNKFSQESKNKLGKSHMKNIVQYNINGNFIKEWSCAADATYFFIGNRIGSRISSCCNGTVKTAYGFIWKFKDKI